MSILSKVNDFRSTHVKTFWASVVVCCLLVFGAATASQNATPEADAETGSPTLTLEVESADWDSDKDGALTVACTGTNKEGKDVLRQYTVKPGEMVDTGLEKGSYTFSLSSDDVSLPVAQDSKSTSENPIEPRIFKADDLDVEYGGEESSHVVFTVTFDKQASEQAKKAAEEKAAAEKKAAEEKAAAEKKAAEEKEKAAAEKRAAEEKAAAEKKAADEQAAAAAAAANSSSSSSSASGGSSASSAPSGNTATVYVAASGNGSKYHTNPNCSRMKGTRSMTVSEAVSAGYGPCKKCA